MYGTIYATKPTKRKLSFRKHLISLTFSSPLFAPLHWATGWSWPCVCSAAPVPVPWPGSRSTCAGCGKPIARRWKQKKWHHGEDEFNKEQCTTQKGRGWLNFWSVTSWTQTWAHNTSDAENTKKIRLLAWTNTDISTVPPINFLQIKHCTCTFGGRSDTLKVLFCDYYNGPNCFN